VPEPQWAVFVGLTAIILTSLLALARLSQSFVRDDHVPPGRLGAIDQSTPSESEESDLELGDPTAELDADHLDVPERQPRARTEQVGALTAEELAEDPFADEPAGGDRTAGEPAPPAEATMSLSTTALLANVALTQGVFGVLVLAAAFYTSIPASAFGVTGAPTSTGLPAVATGIGLGVALYVGNELAAAAADALGFEYDERLRSMLAPDTAGEWAILFLAVLPIIAGVEELVFRAAIIGVTAAGFGTSPWALAVLSSLAFAYGHGAQGRVGIVVTGGLGFVLAAAFVVTGSFLVVFVAHYLVNALEFLVHELLGIEWTG